LGGDPRPNSLSLCLRLLPVRMTLSYATSRSPP